jgi:signal transduction histidine kinase/DNA-binding response OmpR family regulator
MKNIFLFFLVLICWKGYSQPQRGELNLSSKTNFYVDSTSSLSFEAVKNKQFKVNEKSSYSFGFSPYTVWLKLEFAVSSEYKGRYVLQLNNPYIDVADLYLPNTDGSYRIIHAGDYTPFKDREIKNKYPCFYVDVPQFSTQRPAYIKIRNSQYNTFNVLLSEEDYFREYNEFDNSDGFRLGLTIMRLLFHIALLIFLFHDTRFRAYSFWGIALCITYLNLGSQSSFLFPQSPFLVNYAFYFSISWVFPTMCYYVYEVLELRKNNPKAKYVLIFLGSIGIANLVVQLFVSHAYVNRAVIALLALMLCYFSYLIIKTYLKGYRPSIWYMIPLIIYIPSFTVYYLRNAGLFDLYIPIVFLQVNFTVDFFFVAFLIGAMLRNVYKDRLAVTNALFVNKLESEKLKEMDKVKTSFFANVSHEFRTPLTLLLAPAEELIKKYPGEGLLPVIRRNGQRLLTLINQLLNMTRLEAGQMNLEIRQADLARFIALLAESFVSLAESKGINYEISVTEREHKAYFDPEKLEIILNNLLSNAFKFTPKGGRVHISFDYSPDLKSCIIEVSDTGIGMPAEHLDKIFDRFYQIDGSSAGSHEGSGIGLALVKELTELIKGKIWVKSKEKQGTVFSLKIPVDEATWKEHTPWPEEQVDKKFSPVIGEQADETEEMISPAGPLLLIVDDNHDIRKYLRSVFEDTYQVLEAVDGHEGINKAIAHVPDLVICDLMMPLLDGFGFCRLLKANEATDHIPVIMLTAKASLESRIEGFELGADEYLTKPFNTDEIKARVNNLIRQRELLREKFDLRITGGNAAEVRIKSGDELFVEKVKNIIENNLEDNHFDLSRLSEELHMSSEQLRRKLKAVTGLKPIEFIRKYRLQRAAEMLKQKNGTVSKIAYQVGFESLSYFSKVFQEEYGISPSEF